jgi:two-component system, NarL family, response regulator DevR
MVSYAPSPVEFAIGAMTPRESSMNSEALPMMNTSARQALPAREAAQAALKDSRGSVNSVVEEASRSCDMSQNLRKIRVRVDSGNRAWHDGLIKMLGNRAGLEMLSGGVNEIFRVEKVLEDLPDVLLLTSCGNLDSDISNIRKVRVAAPGVRIVMFGGAGAEREFLQYVRAGIRGYVPLGATVTDVWETLEAVHAGKACCPSALCVLLFNYFEREATSLPSGMVRQKLGLTRREQQLVPLIAQGLTNKEIANRFCLSEQTVKNHLYRMKHKVGADNRLGIVQTCHTQGFLL